MDPDIFVAIKPALFISSCFGLSPFKIVSDEKQLKTSLFWAAYGILLLLFYALNASYTVYVYFFEKTDKESDVFVSSTNRICQFGCGITVTISAILLPIIQREKYFLMVRGFYDAAENMAKLNLYIPLKRARILILYFIAIIIFGIGLLFLHDLFICDGIGNENMCDWVTYFLPNFYNYLMELEFVLGALLLRKHFIALNNYLISLNGPIIDDEFAINETSVSSIEHLTSILVPKKATQNSFVAWDGNFPRLRLKDLSASNGLEKTEQRLENLKTFRKIHNSLCDLKENLNSAFSLQLLTCVAQAFVVITSNLFLLFTILSDSKKRETGCISYPIIWVLVHVIELVTVVVTCTKTCKAANRTAIVVHKLLARDCDPVIRNQLKLFSIQLLHRKISFSACGFFTLDMTLLQAIIGAATTYLVILIQFHNTNPK